MFWRHVVASTLPERTEFAGEKVNNPSYQTHHLDMILKDGFSFSGFERDKVWMRVEDKYLDVSDISGADDENDGRSLCVADFDNDGDQDFFVHNIQRERHMLYRNDVVADPASRSVAVLLSATKGHPQGFGAVVVGTLAERKLAKLNSCGAGYLSQNATELIFGTGEALAIEVSVRWPGRETESFGALKVGGRYLLVEGTGKPREMARKRFEFRDPAAPGIRVRAGDKLEQILVLDEKGAEERVAVKGLKKPLLVNFWASYCSSCVAELVDFEALCKSGAADVVLVNLDSESDRKLASSLLAAKGVTCPCRFVSDELMEKLLDPERLPLPTTLVFGPDGTLEEVIQGPISAWPKYKILRSAQ